MTTLLRLPSKRPLVILAYPRVEHEKDYLYHWMPFSLLTVAKPLLDGGLVDVVIFDGNQSGPADWALFLDEHLERAICIGVSIMTGGAQIRHALAMVGEAKRHAYCPPVVFGGPHVNVLAEQTARHELVDMVLVGPGQNSMPPLVEVLLGQGVYEDVPGLLMRRDGRLLHGPVNPPKTGNMGRYPWHLLNVAEYIRDDPTIAPRTLNYVSSQGCVYKCQFCYELTYQRKYSAMEAGGLVDDVADLANAYDISGIKFYDADFFVNVRRAVEFCDELMARKLALAWAASINPNDVLRARRQKLDLLGRIAASGCRRLLMGIESGADRVLRDIVRKEITRDEAYDVASDIAAHGTSAATPSSSASPARRTTRLSRPTRSSTRSRGLSRGRKRGYTCSARSPARRCSMTHSGTGSSRQTRWKAGRTTTTTTRRRRGPRRRRWRGRGPTLAWLSSRACPWSGATHEGANGAGNRAAGKPCGRCAADADAGDGGPPVPLSARRPHAG